MNDTDPRSRMHQIQLLTLKCIVILSCSKSYNYGSWLFITSLLKLMTFAHIIAGAMVSQREVPVKLHLVCKMISDSKLSVPRVININFLLIISLHHWEML